jgi:hypothetical protein
MATELLAAGNTAATSSTFVLAAGDSATILLKPAAGTATVPLQAGVVIEAEDSGSRWIPHQTVKGSEASFVLTAEGTFRVRRPAQTFSVGVDRG